MASFALPYSKCYNYSAAMNNNERNRVIQVVGDVLKAHHPEAVYLVGSSASGRAKEDSDIDFIVVSQADEQEYYRNAMNDLWHVDAVIDLLVYQPSTFKSKIKDNIYFRNTINRGRVLYEQAR